MAKIPTQSYQVIKELLDCLVGYADHLTEPPADAEIIPEHRRAPQTYRFVINSPADRAEAILKLLFGEDEVRRKRGPRGFREYDIELMRQLKEEMVRTGKTMQELLDQYVEIAQARSTETQDESIRERLEDAYYALAKQPSEYDYDTLTGLGFENFTREELSILMPWLQKYRAELINLLAA